MQLQPSDTFMVMESTASSASEFNGMQLDGRCAGFQLCMWGGTMYNFPSVVHAESETPTHADVQQAHEQTCAHLNTDFKPRNAHSTFMYHMLCHNSAMQPSTQPCKGHSLVTSSTIALVIIHTHTLMVYVGPHAQNRLGGRQHI